MASQSLFAGLNAHRTGETRIQYMRDLKAMGHPFHLEPQPDAVLQKFYTPDAPASDVARTFIHCFGSLIICRELSAQAGRFMTILDSLEQTLSNHDAARMIDRVIDLIQAFSSVDVRNAEWYDPRAMIAQYNLDPIYENHHPIDPSNDWSDSDSDDESFDESTSLAQVLPEHEALAPGTRLVTLIRAFTSMDLPNIEAAGPTHRSELMFSFESDSEDDDWSDDEAVARVMPIDYME